MDKGKVEMFRYLADGGVQARPGAVVELCDEALGLMREVCRLLDALEEIDASGADQKTLRRMANDALRASSYYNYAGWLDRNRNPHE